MSSVEENELELEVQEHNNLINSYISITNEKLIESVAVATSTTSSLGGRLTDLNGPILPF